MINTWFREHTKQSLSFPGLFIEIYLHLMSAHGFVSYVHYLWCSSCDFVYQVPPVFLAKLKYWVHNGAWGRGYAHCTIFHFWSIVHSLFKIVHFWYSVSLFITTIYYWMILVLGYWALVTRGGMLKVWGTLSVHTWWLMDIYPTTSLA